MSDIHALRERAKELRCLYAIDSVVSERSQTPGDVFLRVLREIPAGWQHPVSTGARIEYLGHSYVSPVFESAAQVRSEPIQLWGTEVGSISVSTTQANGHEHAADEAELLRRIAKRLGEYLEWKQTELLSERSPAVAKHWAWRERFSEALAGSLDADRFGVSRMYLGGSTARGDARSGSDIDLYITSHGSDQQRKELALWIEGWSLCLAQFVHQQTGESFPNGIFNVQWFPGEPGVWQQSELQELKLR